MDIEKINESTARINSSEIIINNVQDALDIMADCYYQGINKIIINREIITDIFFDLKTGIAGEILQKFSNYRSKLAIIGDFSKITSKSLKDFIYESNKKGDIIFTSCEDEAIKSFS